MMLHRGFAGSRRDGRLGAGRARPETRWWATATVTVCLILSAVVRGQEEPGEGAPAPKEPGLQLLDEATETKLAAARLSDLDRVVELCKEALAKGLSDGNEAYARQMLTSSLYERAQRLVQPVLDGQIDATWERRRNLAMLSLEEALKYNEADGESWLLIGQLQQLPGGDVERGREASEKALTLFEDNPPRQSVALVVRAAYQTDAAQQLADLDDAVRLDPANLEAWRVRAQTQLGAGDADAAIQGFLHVLEKDGEDIETLDAVARAFASQEKYETALGHIQKAIELEPSDPGGYTLRASVYLMQNEVQQALKDLEKALELEPRDLAALLMRAQVYAQERQFEKADADLERALRIRPGLAEAMMLRSSIAAAAGEFDKAIQQLQRLLRRDPGNVELKLQIAVLYQANQRPRKAIEIYNGLLEENPEQIDALRSRGDALLGVGDHAAAVADYEKALELDPTSSGVLNNLAWVLATSTFDELRDGTRALEFALKACEETKYQESHIVSTLASAYAEIGDFEKAIEWSTKAVELEEAQGGGEVIEQLRSELKSYQDGKPWRERQTEQDQVTAEPSVNDLLLGPAEAAQEPDAETKSPAATPSVEDPSADPGAEAPTAEKKGTSP